MKRRFVLYCCSVLLIAIIGGCASKGAVPANDELTLRLITSREATSKFSVDSAPNPFIARVLAFTTLPNHFLTAVLHVPKTIEQFEILDMAIVSEDGERISEAATMSELKDFWKLMTNDEAALMKQFEAIDRYYLPGDSLSGKKLGKDYVIVFQSKEKFKSSDVLQALFLVDGQEKDFSLDASSVISDKK